MDPALPDRARYLYESQYNRVGCGDGTGQGPLIHNSRAREFQLLQLGDRNRALSQAISQAPAPGYYDKQPQHPTNLQIPQGGDHLQVPPYLYHLNVHYRPPHNDNNNPNPAEEHDQSPSSYLSPLLVPADRTNDRIRKWIDGVKASGPLMRYSNGGKKNKKKKDPRPPPSDPHRHAATEFAGGSSVNNQVDGTLHAPPLDSSQISNSLELKRYSHIRRSQSPNAGEERV